MRIFITGVNGFVGRNLKSKLEKNGHDIFIIDDFYSGIEEHFPINGTNVFKDVDIFKTSADSLCGLFQYNEIDLVVHNAALVGTDVCAQYPHETINTNTMGTFNVALACQKADIPIIYMGTTVIYDTFKYQEEPITEESEINPRTLYGLTKWQGEEIIKGLCENSGYIILRPLFCYGGNGDMNSLIAKSVFASKNDVSNFVKIFLNPAKFKSYMHIDDFTEYIKLSIDNFNTMSNDSYNAASSEKYPISVVENILESQGINIGKIQWLPETDYLGNHIIDNSKIVKATDYEPQIRIEDGVKRSISEIMGTDKSSYDPLFFLNKIENENLDYSKWYPQNNG